MIHSFCHKSQLYFLLPFTRRESRTAFDRYFDHRPTFDLLFVDLSRDSVCKKTLEPFSEMNGTFM